MNYPSTFSQFTDDDLERQALSAIYVEPTSQSDSHHEEVQRLVLQLATATRALSPKHRKIVELFFQGKTKREIIDQLQTSYPTIASALSSPKGLKLFSLYTQISELRSGPSREARTAMLWRIAKRAEGKAPSVSLKAVDILNRQAGDYKVEDTHETGLVVNINQFTLTAAPVKPVKDITPIEGDFQPITITTPETPDERHP